MTWKDINTQTTQLDPSARSSLSPDLLLVYSRDFDGRPTATVLLDGIVVAYCTHPESNWGDNNDAEHTLYGWQAVVVDADPAQQQSLAALYEHVGEAREGFTVRVADLGSIYKAYDDVPPDDPDGSWCGEGHEWIAFGQEVADHLHRRFPGECPDPDAPRGLPG